MIQLRILKGRSPCGFSVTPWFFFPLSIYEAACFLQIEFAPLESQQFYHVLFEWYAGQCLSREDVHRSNAGAAELHMLHTGCCCILRRTHWSQGSQILWITQEM